MKSKELSPKAKEKHKKKELVKELWDVKSPRYLKLMDDFIVEHFNNEDDKDLRRDAHKLFGKLFDTQVAKKVNIEGGGNGGGNTLTKQFEEALNAVVAQGRQRIEVQEAEIISPEEAANIKSIGRK